MGKKVWLINHYAMPPEIDPRIRTVKFAQFLIDRGYDVTVISASSMHNFNTNLINGNRPFIEKKYGDIKFIHIKARTYTKNDYNRVINLFEFPIRLFINGSKFEKPDIILHTATVPFGNIVYFLAKRLKAKYIVEVLDLWPESFHSTGMISKRNPLLIPLYWAEKWLYKKADKLIFSMEGGKDYIIEKKWDMQNGGPIDIKNVFHINNGVDLREFNNYKNEYRLDDEDLNNKETFKIIYIGAVRLFNNIKLLIDSAKFLAKDKRIRILIYGDGNEREMLIDYVHKNNIDNVIFKDKFVEKRYIPYILSKSSLNILNYQQNSLWRFGGSQNKIFQYFASGKPVCSNINMGYCLIRKYNCGISHEFSSPEEYANSILKIANLPHEEYLMLCKNAELAAKEYDFNVLTDKLVNVFET